ncbi:Adenylosuccinate synthetase [Apiosordaria backusii]|uniref:Adenylosuccinate synthetase n=1 Tax=Apiosordaria backusii TaxID=314023 RepID=A0AA40BEN2_9PEZI|nr:Adenylosuccinate synthetase [Apiosordaria backusii]
MPTTIILGSQWGDEGKGKLSDILCQKAQICARAAGGHNAGHSVVANGVSYDFHLLPSGLINPNCENLIGSGVVVNVEAFFKELNALEEKGLKHVRDKILISDRAHVNLTLHAAADRAEEAQLEGNKKIGTTGRGIGPSYATKASRKGIRVHEIFKEAVFEKKLRALTEGYKKEFGELFEYDVEEEISRFREYRKLLPNFVCDGPNFIDQAQRSGRDLLVEGANALMLDIDYGTYPYVTSSNTGLGGAVTGLALDYKQIKEVIGVVKAYTTRVGGGPFKTEDLGEAGTKLQEIGREWGVSTGRRRRCGWLDLVVLKYSQLINNYTSWNLTKLDILDTFPTIKVAVAYKDPETGETLEHFPADLDYLDTLEVVYKEFEGWQTPITSVKTFDALPAQAQAYVKFIEEFTGIPVKWVGTGPARDDMIYL